MKVLRQLAQFVRHLPGIEAQERLWQLLRRPYHWILNSGGSGVQVLVGGMSRVRMPAELSGAFWEQYEPETVAALVGWLRSHPGGRVLDVGSSLGILSAVALFSDPEAEVVAFESDLASVAAAKRMCQYAPGRRLQLVYGFLSDLPTEVTPLASAIAATEAELARAGTRGEVGTTRFACLADLRPDSPPARRLDDLLAAEGSEGVGIRPTLLKCDVEGAELLVLRGAADFLRRARPELLLSVHPPALPTYGHSRDEVETFLKALNYEIHFLAADHEEHWWCEVKQKLGMEDPAALGELRSLEAPMAGHY